MMRKFHPPVQTALDTVFTPGRRDQEKINAPHISGDTTRRKLLGSTAQTMRRQKNGLDLEFDLILFMEFDRIFAE